MAGRTKLTPLKWSSHRLTPSTAKSLQSLTRSVRKSVAGPVVDVLPPGGSPEALSLPQLPDDPVEKAARLLQAAAEIEHALLVQYLYAGYGFSTPNSEILGIAIEEMSHLMTIQNLLRLIGRAPHLGRQDFGAVPEDEDLFPFPFLLEPISHRSLAKYVVAESPLDVSPGVAPVVMARISDLVTQGIGSKVNRVGTLYALLGAVFGSEQLLLQKAATGDPWYITVNSLAAEATTFYGGRDKLHLPEHAFRPGTVVEQGNDQDWDRSVEKTNGLDEFRVHVASTREEALEALRDIGLQGEGPSSAGIESPHFQRFYDLFIRFFGVDGMGTNPPPKVATVPSGVAIVVDEHSTDPNTISHPDTVLWAKLADLRYAMLLGSLEMYLRIPSTSRQFLRGWAFAEMYGIRKMAEWLPKMQRTQVSTPAVAAMPFNMPEWSSNEVTWADIVRILDASATLIAKLAPGFPETEEKGRVLYHLLKSDERKIAEARAREGGMSARTKADWARETLDWAAGVADPGHNGSSPHIPDADQGRFWNLPLAEFKQAEVFGSKIVELPAEGGDAELIEVLRKKQMPKDRPKLAEDSQEFQVLEKWVKEGCKDEPV